MSKVIIFQQQLDNGKHRNYRKIAHVCRNRHNRKLIQQTFFHKQRNSRLVHAREIHEYDQQVDAPIPATP